MSELEIVPVYSGWPSRPLEAVTSLISRGVAPVYVRESSVKVIGQRCVTTSGFDPSFARPHDARRAHRALVVQPGDVLLNSTGTGTIGRSCLFSSSGEYVADGHITVIRPDSRVVDGGWLNYLIQSPWGQRFLETSCYSGSTNQVELSRSKLAVARVPVPSLAEQRKIVQILDIIGNSIYLTSRLILKLEMLTSGLMENSFSGISGDRTVQLQDIARVDRGKFTHRPRNDPRMYGGDFPFVQTGDIAAARGSRIFSASQTLNGRGARISSSFPAGTIAVTIAANIADTAILGREMYFPDSVVGVQVTPPNSVRFVEMCIRRAKPKLESRAPQSAQKNINLTDLRPLQIPLVSLSEQYEISDLYDSCDCLMDVLRSELSKLQDIRRGLMADLVTGQVRARV